jgi:quercetin dioxygenase-like cupin family protein
VRMIGAHAPEQAVRGRSIQPKRTSVAEIIRMGGVELMFLQSGETTAGSLDMFEMTLQPNARVPVPHHHENWDETVYGLAGRSAWHVDGEDIGVTPGAVIFIRRDIVHGFVNRGDSRPSAYAC